MAALILFKYGLCLVIAVILRSVAFFADLLYHGAMPLTS